MDKAAFDQAKLFMFSDIEREIQLSKVDRQALEQLGVNPGGGNVLAALGLLCYTEFGGKLISGTNEPTKNFNRFFDRLGTAYQDFRQKHPDVYNVFRCGLAHEYFIKKSCAVYISSKTPGPGIGVQADGRYFFAVEDYCRDLQHAFDVLEGELFGAA